MQTKTIRFFLIGAFLFISLSPLEAGLIDHEKLRKRQQRKNPPPTVSSEQQWKNTVSSFLSSQPEVKTRQGRQYDDNRDGQLQERELNKLLNDLIIKVENEGQVLVEMELMKNFDQNKDEQITSDEADVIRQILKEKENN